MDSLLSVGLSHQGAMLRRMDVVANNIANSSTTSFKRERVVFQNHLYVAEGDAPEELRQINMVLDYGVVPDMGLGELEPTGNPLDVAIEGEGFIVVENEGGERLYTRSGRLRIDDQGRLSTRTGEIVLGVDDQPLRFNPDDVDIQIANDGTVGSSLGEIGQIQLVQFPSYQGFERRGDSLFSTTQAELPPEGLKLLQGALEGSNVNPIQEVTNMIEILRSYQSMESSLNDYSDMRDRAVERLSRIDA